MNGEALKILRMMKEMKSKDLAVKLDISPSYLSLIENSHKKPTLEIVEKYAEVFNMKTSSVIYLMEDYDDETFAGRTKNGTREIFIKVMKKLQKLGDLYEEDENEKY